MKRSGINVLIAICGLTAVSLNASAASINERRENQQDRIAQGVQNGQLTARETAHLESREARVNRQIRRDRAANGGHLTAGERAQVTREQNRMSRSIYRQKHDVQHQ